jgi:hypothetical protein
VQVYARSMSRDGLTRQEAVAGAVLAHHLACRAHGAEDGRTEGMVDLWLDRDGVTFGAAEVTIAGDEAGMQTEALAFASGGHPGWAIRSTRPRWVAHYTSRSQITGAPAMLQALVTLCDLHGVDLPERLPLDVRLDTEPFDRYLRHGWRLRTYSTESTHAPAEALVYVQPDTVGALVPDDLDGLVDWVNGELAGRWRSKVDKLHDVGVAERHLVIVGHHTGPPVEVLVGASPPVLPRPAPVDVGLSGLWLLLPFGADFLRWTPAVGWEWLALP